MSWNNFYIPYDVDRQVADLFPCQTLRSQPSATNDVDADNVWDRHSLQYTQEVSLQAESPADYGPISTPTDTHSTHSRTSPPSPPPSVKIEPDDPDSRFIMELAAFPPQSTSSSRSSPDSATALNDASQSSTPPVEVPLRATQASKEMRRMMGVFRLNPFAMHTLSRGGDSDDSANGSPTGTATWCGEAGPLEEEPVMFEFQLDITGLQNEKDMPESSSTLPTISAQDESQLRSFSPSFELHEGNASQSRNALPSEGFENQDVFDDQVIQEKDSESDCRQRPSNPWEDLDYSQQAESDGSASTSTTVSVHTPLNESSCSPFQASTAVHLQDHLVSAGCHEQTQTMSPTADLPSPTIWDSVGVPDQYHSHEGPASVAIALGAGSRIPYGYSESPHREGRFHLTNSHPYLRTSYARPYTPHLHQTQPQPNLYMLNMSTQQSVLSSSRRPSVVQESSPSQESEQVPLSPSALSPLSPATPNSIQFAHLNRHGQYQSPPQTPTHQMPLYASHSAAPTPVSVGIPISVRRCAMGSAMAFSGVGGTPSSNPQRSHNMRSPGQGYSVNQQQHHFEQATRQREVYSTPQSPIAEGHGDEYTTPSSALATSGMPNSPVHPTLQRSGSHHQPGGVVNNIPLLGNPNSRRWSLPETRTPVGVNAHTGVTFLGHHM